MFRTTDHLSSGSQEPWHPSPWFCSVQNHNALQQENHTKGSNSPDVEMETDHRSLVSRYSSHVSLQKPLFLLCSSGHAPLHLWCCSRSPDHCQPYMSDHCEQDAQTSSFTLTGETSEASSCSSEATPPHRPRPINQPHAGHAPWCHDSVFSLAACGRVTWWFDWIWLNKKKEEEKREKAEEFQMKQERMFHLQENTCTVI